MNKNKKSRRYKYYRKQRWLGVALMLLGIMAAIVLDGDITVSLLIVPLGIYICFTKNMILLNDYFYEIEAEKKK